MKKFLSLVIIASFMLVGLCFATKTPTTKTSLFMTNLKKALVGKTWKTTAHSNVKKADGTPHSVHGLKAEMECTTTGTSIACKVYTGKTAAEGRKTGNYEEWTFTNTGLKQTEYVDGKATDSYGATAKATKSAIVRDYYINCTDATRTKCDAGVGGKTYWNISVDPVKNTFKYIVRGFVKETDTTVGTRHVFSFTPTKASA